MKKYYFVIFLAGCLYFQTQGTINCLAMDEGGCLTCHKYPGLVRLEKPDGFKVFHIDEEKFLESPHGKIDCRECHKSVIKVPHTGETKVECTNCTNECHKSDHDIRNMHKQEQSFITSLKEETSCRECHPLYPHSENNLVRALLNMHTGFMLCEVCHIKRHKFINLGYEWTDSENAQFVGKPFGTHFNPKTRKAQKSENFISRISAYTTEKGKKRSLMNTWDTKKAKQFMSEEENLKAEVKEQRLRYFHEDINKKEISVACNECHSSNSILDFKSLGFDDKKSTDLIYLNVKGLVTKYKTFYLPKLFPE